MKTNEGQETRAAALFFSQRAVEIAEFCLHHGGRCFRGWPVPLLYAYAFFHVVDRTVFVVREHGEIVTVVFMYGRPEMKLRADPKFDWKRSEDQADSLLIDTVVGNRQQLRKLAKPVAARWPDWLLKKLFIFRYRGGEKPVLEQLTRETVERMLNVVT